jgi:hypothetical protein
MMNMKRQMMPNPGCRVQQLFMVCFESWLETLETQLIPEMSGIPSVQRELLDKAIKEQQAIGWIQCFRGYLSGYWAKAVAAHPGLEQMSKSKRAELCNVWAHKVVTQLWKFAADMWEHRNDNLHNIKSDSCRKMRSTAVDIEITLLYGKIGGMPIQDRWRFNTPLAMQLKMSLQSKQRWLSLTKMLVDSTHSTGGQGQH